MRIASDCKAAGFRREMVDSVRGAEEWDSWHSKVFFVPKVDASFIADFDFCVYAPKEFFGTTNDRVFRLVGRIFVEVEEIVVTNSVLRVLAFEYVPYCLEQCSCSEPPI